MNTLQDLYLQNPFWIWLAVGAVFVALDIVSGSGKLISAGVAAIVLALVNLLGVRLGAPIEIGVFSITAVAGGDHRLRALEGRSFLGRLARR